MLAAIPGVTVLIHDQQCAAEKRRLRKRGKQADPRPARLHQRARVRGLRRLRQEVELPVASSRSRPSSAGRPQIHQSSCNKDYSCLLGDCPSFLTIEPVGRAREEGAAPDAARRRAARARAARCPRDGFAAAHDGHRRHRRGHREPDPRHRGACSTAGTCAGLDQTGLSQKGGPVVSDLKIASRPHRAAPTRSRPAAPTSTWASTSSWPPTRSTSTRRSRAAPSRWCRRARSPPARWWWTPRVHFPELERHADEHRPGHAQGPERLPRRAGHGGGALRRPHGDQPHHDGRRLPGGRAADLGRVHRARDPAQRRVAWR